jgi:hypothetical protein
LNSPGGRQLFRPFKVGSGKSPNRSRLNEIAQPNIFSFTKDIGPLSNHCRRVR